MVARFAGASLGLLAFAVTAVSGLLARNPVDVTLSRCIVALVLFCILGFLLGGVAQRVVGEYEKEREAKIQKRFAAEMAAATGAEATDDGAESALPQEGEGEPSVG